MRFLTALILITALLALPAGKAFSQCFDECSAFAFTGDEAAPADALDDSAPINAESVQALWQKLEAVNEAQRKLATWLNNQPPFDLDYEKIFENNHAAFESYLNATCEPKDTDEAIIACLQDLINKRIETLENAAKPESVWLNN